LNAGWDEDLLGLQLRDLRDLDFNLDLTGFDELELSRLLADDNAVTGLTDEDAVPELPETPVSVLRDLWSPSNHKLLVGDATVRADVDRLMAADAADLAFTDPPYNIDYEGYTEDRLKIQGDRMGAEEFQQFLVDSFGELCNL
jgi:hypothetical protein